MCVGRKRELQERALLNHVSQLLQSGNLRHTARYQHLRDSVLRREINNTYRFVHRNMPRSNVDLRVAGDQLKDFVQLRSDRLIYGYPDRPVQLFFPELRI